MKSGDRTNTHSKKKVKIIHTITSVTCAAICSWLRHSIYYVVRQYRVETAKKKSHFHSHRFYILPCSSCILFFWIFLFFFVQMIIIIKKIVACVLSMTWFFPVLKYGIRFHANIQSNLYDAIDWSLERMFAVFSSNATRISIKFMGSNQRITGERREPSMKCVTIMCRSCHNIWHFIHSINYYFFSFLSIFLWYALFVLFSGSLLVRTVLMGTI